MPSSTAFNSANRSNGMDALPPVFVAQPRKAGQGRHPALNSPLPAYRRFSAVTRCKLSPEYALALRMIPCVPVRPSPPSTKISC